ncbi:carbohydrate ABC transporter permease [Rhizobium sp. LC145]|uniref:carbohydrate ABC transporter permease n=1 Tax=Rhizobium sp. LC145 TaxID=1120688 RepID=UPI00062A505D|nr:carbohydrate ABC transporter permease [Rhizobium sp. LC145]KKX33009.1 ABC transporter permease [Rhizobium sp. LC145]TKT55947.1 carbohydrate ABC transporter permease [Rhizobiaceae bacterium LC148]
MFDLSSRTAKVVFFGTMCLIGFYMFFPLYWMITSSLKDNAELYRVVPTLYPHEITLKNYWTAISESKLLTYLTNSLITSGSSALLNTILALYAGFSFAKYRYFGRQPVMLFMLSAQMFPFGLLLISLYPLMTEVGLLDTRLGLILSYIVFALPVATYMLYSYFSQVPDELIDAARADGASDFRIFHTIVIPISIPPIVTVFLYSFMWSWNDLLYSMTVIVSDEKRTIGPGLLLTYLNELNADWGGAMAASLLVSAPIVAAFMFLQRYFIQGVTAGAVK